MFVVSMFALAADPEAPPGTDCRTIRDADARLACYDAIKPPLEEEAPAPVPPDRRNAPESQAAPVPEPEALNDQVGRESLEHKDPAEQVKVKGRVVECRTNARGSYFFLFDNGQMWQQKDSKRIVWEDCDFEVTIDKDYFGYGMVRDGDDRRIRISRVR